MIKKYLERFIINYVFKNKHLQNEIVAMWSGGNGIATYHIKDSEVTLANVNMIYSSIVGCTVKAIKDSVFKDSPIEFKVDGK